MLAVVSLSSFAQFGGGQFQMPKPEEMATRRADQVKEQVKDAGQLTDDQYKKVYDLYLKQSKDMQAKMNEGGGGFGAFNMEDMQKQQEATNKALKEILSEEQFKAYQKAQEEMMKRFQQGGGFGG
jgi:DnaJ-class molecular chaperone